jgi:hypothetical protein
LIFVNILNIVDAVNMVNIIRTKREVLQDRLEMSLIHLSRDGNTATVQPVEMKTIP